MTISYTLTGGQIIEEAFRVLGMLRDDNTLTFRMYEDGRTSLNIILKGLGGQDLPWTRTEATQALSGGVASYALSPFPQLVMSVRAQSAGIDTPLTELSREEYYNLPSKAASSSGPRAYYFDPQVGTGTVIIWPTPDSTVAASTSLSITYRRKIDDVSLPGDAISVPQEWLAPLSFMLAADLGIKYPVDEGKYKAIKERGAEYLAIVAPATPDSVFIQVPVIAEAFELIGRRNITAEDYARAVRSLDMLIGSWSAQSHLWTTTEGTATLVASQAAYVLSPKPQRILSVRRRTNGIDVPLNEMARSTYFDQPNKTTSPSTPVSYYYDPQVSTGTLYLWPAPAAAVVPTITINFTYLRAMASFDGVTLDMPVEWTETVAWNLAARLKTKYPMDDKQASQNIDLRAEMLFDKLKGWDNEPASLFFQPDLVWDGYGYRA